MILNLAEEINKLLLGEVLNIVFTLIFLLGGLFLKQIYHHLVIRDTLNREILLSLNMGIAKLESCCKL